MTREEAINTLRNIYQTDKMKEALSVLIPELHESEDERIYNEIMEFFKMNEKRCIVNNSYTRWISWLKKQKEQKQISFNEPYNPENYEVVMEGNATSLKHKEQKSIEDVVKDITKNKESAIKFLKSAGIMNDNGELAEIYRSEQTPANYCSVRDEFDLDGNLKHKPAEWSEEDEKIVNFIISILGQYIDYKAESGTGSGYATPRYSKEIAWLKSLCPQPKQDWSEEDETRYLSCLNRLETGNPSQPETVNSKWFKEHVHSRPFWKPSEEQMRALEITPRYFPQGCPTQVALISLYEQLKKL